MSDSATSTLGGELAGLARQAKLSALEKAAANHLYFDRTYENCKQNYQFAKDTLSLHIAEFNVVEQANRLNLICREASGVIMQGERALLYIDGFPNSVAISNELNVELSKSDFFYISFVDGQMRFTQDGSSEQLTPALFAYKALARALRLRST